MTDVYEGLNTRQRAYVEHRLKGLAPKPAAAAAGFSPSYVSQQTMNHLERHPRIKVILREMGKRALKRLALTRDDVLHGLMDAVDGAATSTELTNAWREIGKVIGAYEPEKIKISLEDMGGEDLQSMSVQELAAIADMQNVFEGEFSVEEPEPVVLRIEPESEERSTDG
jgi:hypothetical protein